MNDQTIAAKISKLIAKADSTTHPEEAETFMAKAQELLERHGLSLLDLGKLDADDPVGVDKKALDLPKSYSWGRYVCEGLARYYGCRSVYIIGDKTVFSIAGRESARITMQLMFPFVVRQLKAIAAAAYNRGEYKSRITALNRVGNAMAYRLAEMNRDKEKKDEMVASSTALVPVDVITQALSEAFTGLRDGKSRTLRTDAHSRKLADKVSLNRQTAAPAGTLQLN